MECVVRNGYVAELRTGAEREMTEGGSRGKAFVRNDQIVERFEREIGDLLAHEYPDLDEIRPGQWGIRGLAHVCCGDFEHMRKVQEMRRRQAIATREEYLTAIRMGDCRTELGGISA